MKIYLMPAALMMVLLVACDSGETSITEVGADPTPTLSSLPLAAKPICPGDPRCRENPPGTYEPFLLSPSQGRSFSRAYDVNDSYQVVGEAGSVTRLASTSMATMWEVGSDGKVNGVTTIGTLGGSGSVAQGINNLGQVVGRSGTTAGLSRAFVWVESSGIVELSVPDVGCTSDAFDINDSGQIIGNVFCNGSGSVVVWTVDQEGQELFCTDYGTLNGSSASAWAIADDGSFAGQSTVAEGTRGFVWRPGTGAITIPGSAEALALNSAGVVVGWTIGSGAGVGDNEAFFWTEVEEAAVSMGTLGGMSSLALGVNDAGQIVGASTISRGAARQPFFWEGDALQRLAYPGGPYASGQAHAINKDGAIVGSAGPDAVIWIRKAE